MKHCRYVNRPNGNGVGSVPVHFQRSGDGSLNVKGFGPRPLALE
jgi:hypothetical protein